MKFIYLAIAMASSVLACRPDGTVVDYECGTDGVTYQNAGFRVCAVYPWGSIGLACKGRCPCAQQCNGFAGLTCPDGFTCVDVPNDGCDPLNGGADCIGECVPNACDDIFCTTDYVPVCGSNGVTYGNDCELGRAACFDPSITQVRAGECPSGGNNSTQA